MTGSNVNKEPLNLNFTPKIKITVSGNEIQQADTQGLVYMAIEDHLDMIGVAQISLNTAGIAWSSIKVNDPVEVEIGKTGTKLFSGVVTGLRHAFQKGKDVMTVVAMDPLVLMASSRVTKVFGNKPFTAEDQVDSDIVNQVISAGGCKPGKVDGTTPKFKYVFQRNESNYNFAKRLASRNGYLLRANEGKIDFIKPQFSEGPVELTQEDLMAIDYTLEPINVPPELTVIGWDYYLKEKVEGTAGPGDVLKIGGGDDSSGNNGGIWAEKSFISDVLVTSPGAALEMAKGELNRLARRFIRGRAVVQGNGDLGAGTKVKFTNMKSGFNPEVFVVSARHIVEPGGKFTTEIQFCGNTWPS
jgi:hypothetical protein